MNTQVLAYDLYQLGQTKKQIAEQLGITERQARRYIEKQRALANADPAAIKAMQAVQSNALPHSFWAKTDGYSVYYKLPNDVQEDGFASNLVAALQDYTPPIHAPYVSTGAKGDHLLVVDLADVHFGKLCTTPETSGEYNINEARDRVIHGTRSLLSAASGLSIDRILFVMGNDVLHTENGSATTSGTPQDTDGTFFQAYRAAQYSMIDAIKECSDVAETDLIHCMSNHDWRSGWALSQTVAAYFKGNGRVRATDYNMSEVHRKYYGYERNALMLSHGDGTKEEKIIGHFMQEAKPLVASCDNFYALLHHVHHKVKKTRGDLVFQSEKDHNGMTAIVSGISRSEGSGVSIEYVRSPSAPDGWHHRNGYINRQGVECFAYHAYDGQRVRYTEWF